MSVQKILDCTGHITGGHKKDANFVAESLFDTMNDLDIINCVNICIILYKSNTR